MTKIRQDNNVTDCISLLYTKNNNELPGHIKPGVVYDKSR